MEGSRIPIEGLFLCEGKYDKIKLDSLFDTTVLTVGGFNIYKDQEKKQLIATLAKKLPVYILTDSDKAGFQIRAYLKNLLQNREVHHIYIPDIYGKEKRKTSPSKEGKLGVEGIEKEILLKAVLQVVNPGTVKKQKEPLKQLDFYKLGLTGQADSSNKRKEVLRALQLPQNLSCKGLLEVLNILFDREEALAKCKAVLEEKEK